MNVIHTSINLTLIGHITKKNIKRYNISIKKSRNREESSDIVGPFFSFLLAKKRRANFASQDEVGAMTELGKNSGLSKLLL